VELISALQTSEQTLERARLFAVACGKGLDLSRVPQLFVLIVYFVEVTTSKDVPGFVSNALLMPFINEVSERHVFQSRFHHSPGYHVS
jgi:3-hydroxybutyryl-CoA dehydrogenase